MMRTATLARALLAPVALVIAAACAPAATTAGAGGGATAAFGTPEQIAEGRRLFQSDGRCGLCHGNTGVGGRLGPSLTDDRWIWLQPGSPTFRTDLMTIIRVGVPNPREFQSPMPAMGGAQLFEAQIEALAAYVASL